MILIEADPQAQADARVNAADSPHVEFIVGPVEEVLPTFDRALEALLRISPPKIIYVSCDPPTFARDLSALLAGGEYRLIEIQPIDMFPQSYPIEAVALLTR